MEQRQKRPARQEGQTLALFSLMIVAFVGFCALVVDVGRVYAERRYMQNGADAGVLAATGLVAASIMPCDAAHETDNIADGVCSGITMNEVVQRARAQVNTNASLLGGYTAPIDVVVQYKRYNFATGRCSTAAWTSADILPTSSARMPGDTCKLRVQTTSHWQTWFPLGVGADFTKRDAAAGATATAMIVGDDAMEARGDVWPMTRRRSVINPLNQTINRETPFLFWDSQACKNDDCGPEWKGQISLALNSNRSTWSTTAVPRNQPLEGARLFLAGLADGWRGDQWFGKSMTDYTGRSASWDTRGNNSTAASNFAQEDKFVDLGNWFAYGFGGKVSITRDWSTRTCGNNSTGVYVDCEVPNASELSGSQYGEVYDLAYLGSNNAATLASWWWRATGDWVETYQGDLGNNMSDSIENYVENHGSMNCPFSARWGKCVVIAVYLWEGGQMYAPGTYNGINYTWAPWTSKDKNKQPDRVHLVDFWYFAFYKGILDIDSSSQVRGFFVAKAEENSPGDYISRPSNHHNYYFIVGE